MKRKINTEEISRSHIHDAINLFNLVNTEVSEIKIDNENQIQIKKIKKLIDSSIIHFNEVFETLNTNNSTLYLKSSIDLKDLIDLEIFDVFKDSRLSIEDKVKQNNALIFGNFPLLSKALFNLIENALKVSKSMIKVSLAEEADSWLLKIHTPDEAFNEELASSFERLKPVNSRHGLKSSSEILKYHDAKIEVYNLYTSENSISIYFPKLKQNYKNHFNQKNSFSKFNKKFLAKLIIIFLFFFTIHFSYFNYERNYQDKLKLLAHYENKNLALKVRELKKKIIDIKIALKNDQNILKRKLSGNKIEDKYIILNTYLQMNSLSHEQIKDINNQVNNFYEYQFIKANYLESNSQNLKANLIKLIALLQKLKNMIYINNVDKIIREENIETNAKLILYLQDQEL